MQYNTSSLRRQDRALPCEDALALLRTSEFGILCLQDTAGGGYGVPLNYAWDGADSLYMHSAPAGHKLDCLAREARATFIITGSTQLLPEQFSTAYESVQVQGEAEVVTDDAAKAKALELLIQKLTPQESARGAAYIERALHATTVVRLRIRTICGKAHRPRSCRQA